MTGASIVARSLTAPLKRIAQNAGQNGAVVAERVKEKDFSIGYNAATNEYVDMFEAGIVDPAKVTSLCSAKCCFDRRNGADYRMYHRR